MKTLYTCNLAAFEEVVEKLNDLGGFFLVFFVELNLVSGTKVRHLIVWGNRNNALDHFSNILGIDNVDKRQHGEVFIVVKYYMEETK